MADYFNEENDGRSYERNGSRNNGNNDGDFGRMKGNSFDSGYTGRDRSRGFFDRQSGGSAPRGNGRLDRQLPPIQPASAARSTQRPQQNSQQVPMPPMSQIPMSQTMPQQLPQGAQPQVFPIGNVVLFSPQSYSDVQTLIDHLRRHEPAIVDFQSVDGESGQRILDFLSGAIYALGGSMQRVSGTIFLLTPSGVSITAPADISKSIEDRRNKK